MLTILLYPEKNIPSLIYGSTTKNAYVQLANILQRATKPPTTSQDTQTPIEIPQPPRAPIVSTPQVIPPPPPGFPPIPTKKLPQLGTQRTTKFSAPKTVEPTSPRPQNAVTLPRVQAPPPVKPPMIPPLPRVQKPPAKSSEKRHVIIRQLLTQDTNNNIQKPPA